MATRKKIQPGGGREGWVVLAAMCFVFLALGIAWAALQLGAHAEADPMQLLTDLSDGRTRWTSAATGWAIGLACGLALAVAVLMAPFVVRGRSRKRTDGAARLMGGGRDTAHLRAAGAHKKAGRLAPTVKTPGLAFGLNVRDHRPQYASWEDVLLLVAGPRTQKSVAYAIPTVLAAPGLCFTTSNKPDVATTTVHARSEVGQIWMFDPQGITPYACEMFWNPLTYIAPLDPRTGRARRDEWNRVLADETRAKKLARQFVTSAPGGVSHGDNDYFEKRGATLIGYLLLAAACGERPITAVNDWLNDATDDDPNDFLEAAGFDAQSKSLRTIRSLTEKQRQGVYDGAAETMEFLTVRRYAQWLTPSAPGDPAPRRQFDPVQVAQSTDTIYLLSTDDDSGAGPLLAAMTVAIVDTLEDVARQHGGRLPVPAVGVLDEAANICKFRRLDSLYSYFGSEGINLFTIVQSPAQVKEVWGDRAFEKIWSAANVKLYGGGVDDVNFLQDLSTLIGTHRHRVRTVTRSRGGTSTSHDVREEAIFNVAELRELPPGRAIALASGTPAMLVEPVPWFKSKKLKSRIASAQQETA